MRRTQAEFSRGRVEIFAPQTPARGVELHHGIYVAARDADAELGAPENFQRIGIFPIGLGDYADAVAGIQKNSCNERRTEARVVYVGVPRDYENVDGVPASREHFRARGGNEPQF